jgi:5-methyltetrahydrofolate--homocysteine methyltransferase
LPEPEHVAGLAEQYRDLVLAVGVNCGREMGLPDVAAVVRRYRQATDLPILARPNAGPPTTPLPPDAMGAGLPDLIHAGATLMGGCCGTTPLHIAAVRAVLDRLAVTWHP